MYKYKPLKQISSYITIKHENYIKIRRGQSLLLLTKPNGRQEYCEDEQNILHCFSLRDEQKSNIHRVFSSYKFIIHSN